MGRHGCLASAVLLATAALAWASQPACAAIESSTFQVDPGHSGYVYGAGVVPPLSRAWSLNLNWGNQYVAVAGGRAFAFSDTGDAADDVNVEAIDLGTGKVVWNRTVGSRISAAYLTVDNGVVVTAVDGRDPPDSASAAIVLAAFDASTGAPLWTKALDEQGQPSPPVARDGVMYMDGGGEGSNVYAVRMSDGARLWTSQRLIVGNPVTLAGNVLVDSSRCGLAYGIDIASGRIVWTHDEGCDGGGTLMASFDGADVWGDQGSGDGSGRVFDVANGNVVKRFSWYAPAFGYGEAVQATQKSSGDLELHAFDAATMQDRWSFDENDGAPTTPTYTPPWGSTPLLADGYVFAAGSQGRVWALEPRDGSVVWQDDTGQPASFFGWDPLPGLAAGDGYLLVPSGTWLFAYKGSGYPPPAPPVVTSTPPAGSTGSSARPSVTGLHVTRRRLHAAGDRRTAFVYHLSMAARVRIAIQRATRCRGARTHSRCFRYRTSGSLTRAQAAGKNRLRFAGRIGHRALRRGTYRAVVVATAANGLASAPRSVRFKII